MAVGATADRWRGPWKEPWPRVSCPLRSSTVGGLTWWRLWPRGLMMAQPELPVSCSACRVCLRSSNVALLIICSKPCCTDTSPLSPVRVGVVRTLCEYYQAEKTDCVHVWLSADADHFCSSVGDRGWGCGYRNFQMLLSALHRIETYASVLQGNFPHPLPRHPLPNPNSRMKPRVLIRLSIITEILCDLMLWSYDVLLHQRRRCQASLSCRGWLKVPGKKDWIHMVRPTLTSGCRAHEPGSEPQRSSACSPSWESSEQLLFWPEQTTSAAALSVWSRACACTSLRSPGRVMLVPHLYVPSQ